MLAGPAPVSSEEVKTWTAAMRLAGGFAKRAALDTNQLSQLVKAARDCGDEMILIDALTMTIPALDRMGLFDEAAPMRQEALTRAEHLPEAKPTT